MIKYWLFLIGVVCLYSCQESLLPKEVLTYPVFDTTTKLTSTVKEDSIPLATSFDYPVGIPDAKEYYKAQKFNEENAHFGYSYHLGDDWNGIGGGNTDLGDTIYAIGDGFVDSSKYHVPGWGNVIMIRHKYMEKDSSQQIVSLYAHLKERFVKPKTYVQKGMPIGTMGTADGLYTAHLHFEIRSDRSLPIGPGYASSKNLKGYLDPSLFIKNHRHIK